MLREPIAFFRELADAEGPVAKLAFGKQIFYLVNDPELIPDFLITHSAKFEKFPRIERTKGLFGLGLLTNEGASHLRQRRLMQPAFHRSRLQSYGEEMLAASEAVMAGWRDGETIDAVAAMNRLTLRIVARTLFSTGADERAEEIGRELDIVLHALNRLVMPWGDLWLRSPLPSSVRYKLALKRLDAVIYGFIEARRSRAGDHDDLLRILLEARDDEGTGMDDLQVRDEVMTTFVAGHDTTANGLAWSLYLLAAHPEEQERLAASVGEERVTVDRYASLTAVEHAFSEALRLYPPVWILGRKALERYSYGDLQVEPGGIVLVCMAVLHRRPELFNQPDAFQPARWRDPQWPRYAFLPFGAGARTCIGERFAWMEGVLCLSALLQRWRFRLVDAEAPEPLGLLTLRPKRGLRLRVERR